MLNYGNRLVVVTYCIEFEGLIQLDAEAPIISPAGQQIFQDEEGGM